MIVGFTITDLKGHQKEAIEYIRRVCILENADIAENIVLSGEGVNVFSKSGLEDLDEQPFDSVPIETVDGKYLIVSAVNFNIELTYNGDILRLKPTEYLYVDKSDLNQFRTYHEQNIIVCIPDAIDNEGNWILGNTKWDDNGIWVDSESWRD